MELIDKQAALDIAMSYCPDDDGCCSKACHDIREMIDEIEALPIVHIDDMAFNIQNKIQAEKPSRTVEITFVRRGRWVVNNRNPDYADCTNCGLSEWLGANGSRDYAETLLSGFKKFCPNCGARMDLRTPTEAQLDEADSVMMGGADNDT